MELKNEEEKKTNIPFYFFVGVFSLGFLIGLVYIIYAMFFS
jgi:hypothetical protein